jgi:ferredoxin-like protein FixX
MSWTDAEINGLGDQCMKLMAENHRLRTALLSADCPGGGYTGQPKDEEHSVENCLKAGVCGCTLGAACEQKGDGK